jgi:hypothetical protein
MTPAKSGDQYVRVGEVFMECTEKEGSPNLDFSGRVATASCGGENGSWVKGCKSQDQRIAAGCILTGARDQRWKSRLDLLEPSGVIRMTTDEAPLLENGFFVWSWPFSYVRYAPPPSLGGPAPGGAR